MEINPLNVHNLRELTFVPPHFTKVLFDRKVDKKVIHDWLYTNLRGRFYIGDEDIPGNSAGMYERKLVVAFELGGEASYFSLLLSTINKPESYY